MGLVNPARALTSDAEGVGEIKEANALTALLNEFNGNIDAANLKAGAATADKLDPATALAKLGLSGGGVTRRAYAEVLTEESTALAGPVDLATVGPTVTFNVTAPGLVRVTASWNHKNASSGTSLAYLTAVAGSASLIYNQRPPLSSQALTGSNGTAYLPGPIVNTVDGPFLVTASGSVTLKLQYHSGGGTSTFKDRRLYVETVAF